MFDIAPSELLVLGVVALVVIPPKDLPKAMRFAGQWVGRARGIARQFRAGFDEMIREAELAELKKQWAEENERIMREHPMSTLDYLAPPPPPSPPAIEGPNEDAPPVMVSQPAIVDTTPEAIAPVASAPVVPTAVEAAAVSEPSVEKPKPKRKPRAKAAPPA